MAFQEYAAFDAVAKAVLHLVNEEYSNGEQDAKTWDEICACLIAKGETYRDTLRLFNDTDHSILYLLYVRARQRRWLNG